MQYFYVAKSINELKDLCGGSKEADTGATIGEIKIGDGRIITVLHNSFPDPENSMNLEWLQNTLGKMKDSFGLELPPPATILIHFGSQNGKQCSDRTKAMYAAATARQPQEAKLKGYYFFAVSRENRYPREFWNGKKLTLPAKCEQKTDEQVIIELRDKEMNTLEHLKGIVTICYTLLLCGDDTVINTKLSGETGREYWHNALWDENDKVFSPIEEEIIKKSKNDHVELKKFCDALEQGQNFDLSKYKDHLQSIIELIREQIKQMEQ